MTHPLFFKPPWNFSLLASMVQPEKVYENRVKIRIGRMEVNYLRVGKQSSPFQGFTCPIQALLYKCVPKAPLFHVNIYP